MPQGPAGAATFDAGVEVCSQNTAQNGALHRCSTSPVASTKRSLVDVQPSPAKGKQYRNPSGCIIHLSEVIDVI